MLAMTRVFEKQRVGFKSALERRSRMGATVIAVVFQIKRGTRQATTLQKQKLALAKRH